MIAKIGKSKIKLIFFLQDDAEAVPDDDGIEEIGEANQDAEPAPEAEESGLDKPEINTDDVVDQELAESG